MHANSRDPNQQPAAKTLATLPLPLLLLEAVGVLLLVLAWIAFNDVMALPAWLSGKGAARVLIAIAIGCMLPAAITMMWRTARIIAPQLFATSLTRKKEDKHDTDY